MSAGPPNASRSPCTTSVGRPAADRASSARRDFSGRPGGCSGKASASTPAAPTCARRTAGDPGPGRPAADEQRCRRPTARSRTASQARSSVGGGAATLRPATTPGLLDPDDRRCRAPGSRLASATRSRGPMPPPGAVAEHQRGHRSPRRRRRPPGHRRPASSRSLRHAQKQPVGSSRRVAPDASLGRSPSSGQRVDQLGAVVLHVVDRRGDGVRRQPARCGRHQQAAQLVGVVDRRVEPLGVPLASRPAAASGRGCGRGRRWPWS